ncbi:MAG TPA: hypothetical protein VGQ73_09565 [Gemmatimonadales bacterium]|nr:hypothetical protein [Gemmatimonadales bacterium]
MLVLVLLTFMVLRERASAASAAAAPAPRSETALPDLSTMTPRERFDRLYNRVMSAAESGDTATVSRFGPMVVAAYGQLDTVDADVRYHAAVLQLHVQGNTAAALRLADSILMATPGHLFGFLIRGTAAQLSGNAALLKRARADFLKAWDREMKATRPEYRDHQLMLDQFHAAASAAVGR